MGKIMASALHEAGFKKITIIEKETKNLSALKKELKSIRISQRLEDLQQAEIVFLAIKPQDFKKLNISFPVSSLVVSIMAGVKIKNLKDKFKTDRVIRAMPNILASLSLGFTVWTATKKVSQLEKKIIKKVWLQIGREMYVKSEEQINQATAVTGSGPAYIFYTIKVFMEAAKKIGFSEKESFDMVLSVAEGSIAFIKDNNAGKLDKLISCVASKGGTTEAALKKFSQRKLEKIWLESIQAALKRSRELG